MINDYLKTITAEFERHSNRGIALEQKVYLRNQFEFFGMMTHTRRDVLKPFFNKAYLPPKSELNQIIHKLWEEPQREYQYFCQELASKFSKQLEKDDILLFEYMVINKSWWDTVDFIAAKLMGEYFKRFPEEKESYINKWIASQNIWLQRSALLFQLKYKDDLDTVLLSLTINSLLGSKEFFINKAIGWILREYSKINPDWVIEFANQTSLSPLSRKEALRLVI